MTFIESAGKAILKKENLSAYANLQVTFGATMSQGENTEGCLKAGPISTLWKQRHTRAAPPNVWRVYLPPVERTVTTNVAINDVINKGSVTTSRLLPLVLPRKEERQESQHWHRMHWRDAV